MSAQCCDHNHPNIEELVHGERGTKVVFWLTVATMGLEIFCGWFFGSMALLADGWHMASHAGANAVAWFALCMPGAMPRIRTWFSEQEK